jgi:hypothetical protein
MRGRATPLATVKGGTALPLPSCRILHGRLLPYPSHHIGTRSASSSSPPLSSAIIFRSRSPGDYRGRVTPSVPFPTIPSPTQLGRCDGQQLSLFPQRSWRTPADSSRRSVFPSFAVLDARQHPHSPSSSSKPIPNCVSFTHSFSGRDQPLLQRTPASYSTSSSSSSQQPNNPIHSAQSSSPISRSNNSTTSTSTSTSTSTAKTPEESMISARYYLLQGQSLVSEGQLEEGIEALSKSISLFPHDPMAYVTRAGEDVARWSIFYFACLFVCMASIPSIHTYL